MGIYERLTLEDISHHIHFCFTSGLTNLPSEEMTRCQISLWWLMNFAPGHLFLFTHS